MNRNFNVFINNIFSGLFYFIVAVFSVVLFVADFDLDDEDTCRATVRMFLQCNLVQQFHIPYDVSNNYGTCHTL